ncbi:hypothetical protein GCM10008927_04740 [Amylibacter ulvae]|uniref:DUF7742 domain-containing protein n=1 Tax=Paramylibacter ulvae TaxID=1651968 RepID=A0ABQ3CVH1_9RHOB|nr:hypothetical protein [Amylibacter ulvae]GHA43170.1 hypothetical protein GCM10008927_04740 [Amylibacter ulvae]
MRRIIHSDIFAAARALLCVPADQREQLLAAMFETAHIGDILRRRLGQNDPNFGDGTLRGAAHIHTMKPQCSIADIEFLRCVLVVITKMLDKMLAHQAKKTYKNL